MGTISCNAINVQKLTVETAQCMIVRASITQWCRNHQYKIQSFHEHYKRSFESFHAKCRLKMILSHDNYQQNREECPKLLVNYWKILKNLFFVKGNKAEGTYNQNDALHRYRIFPRQTYPQMRSKIVCCLPFRRNFYIYNFRHRQVRLGNHLEGFQKPQLLSRLTDYYYHWCKCNVDTILVMVGWFYTLDFK